MSTAQRFRKKPVVIEAVRVVDALKSARDTWADLPTWLHDAYERGGVTFASDAIYVNTLEGQMCASLGDWLIRGVQGELYPCKPEIFAATYEPESEPSRAVSMGEEGERRFFIPTQNPDGSLTLDFVDSDPSQPMPVGEEKAA